VANRHPRTLSEVLYVRLPAGTLGRIERLRALQGHGQAELARRLLLPALEALERDLEREGEGGGSHERA
jgi:hypothetical protein